MKKKVIIIIPAYNEEKTIRKVIREVKRYGSEVLVIDDGSSDNTIEFSRAEGAIVIPNIINRGLGVTIKNGYLAALERGADIVVQIDADGQYTATDIPKLIKPIIENKADMVLASRFQGGIQHMPLSNRVGNKIGTFVTSVVSGQHISDAQTGFRAMRRELLDEIIPISKKTYVQEMIIRSVKEGWRVIEVPSYFKKRHSGPSRLISSLPGYAKRAILIILRMIREYHPLLFFGIPGIILMVLGAIFGSYMGYIYFFGSGDVSERTGTIILSSFLMLLGFLLIMIGYLADMIQVKYVQLREEIRKKRL
ncbi:MAG: glycosyltransferase family 2 protein [Candidatus Woesearchaeota archaeon]